MSCRRQALAVTRSVSENAELSEMSSLAYASSLLPGHCCDEVWRLISRERGPYAGSGQHCLQFSRPAALPRAVRHGQGTLAPLT